jgi:hypothetical protein
MLISLVDGVYQILINVYLFREDQCQCDAVIAELKVTETNYLNWLCVFLDVSKHYLSKTRIPLLDYKNQNNSKAFHFGITAPNKIQ